MRKLYFFALFLAIYEFTTYSANDMIMPGMVSVVNDFKASLSYVPLSLSIYMLGECAIHLFLGPTAEYFGKRNTILIGCFSFILFTVIIALSSNINQFILGRFLQGTGMAFIAIGYALIHEKFNDQEAIKITSIMLNITILATLIGPILGVWVISQFSWHYIFIISGTLGFICWLGFYYTLPKSSLGDLGTKPKTNLKQIWNCYINALKSRHFVIGVLSNAFNTLPLMLWIGLIPNIVFHFLGQDYKEFIIYQSITISGLIIASIVIQILINRFQIKHFIKLGSYLSLVGITLSVVLHSHMLVVSICMFLYSFGLGISNGSIVRLIMKQPVMTQNNIATIMTMIRTLLYAIGLQISNQVCEIFNYSVFSFTICCFACTILYSALIKKFIATC